MKLQVENLYKNFGRLQVISDFSMDFSNEGIHCLFGPSGCGKTTLLNILSGITPYNKGNIQGFENKTFSYIFQEERLLPWATVKENLRFVLEDVSDEAEISDRITKYLSLVDLSEFIDSYPDELSGGMKQRVSIARAFAYEGDIIIMDEPFKGLHLDIKKTLMNYVIDYWYRKKGVFIFITHDIDEALHMADFIHVLQGPPLTLKKQITIDIPHKQRVNNKEIMEKYKAMI